ncbi:MAG TPA: biotin transporter BioY [Acidobacteriaceae bacterium]|nr:biotin transporter BioY [Acidobacteriaceae bacterium]
MAETQIQKSFPAAAPSFLPKSRATRAVLAVLAGSALLAASAHVSIPFFFTPVPFTLQPFAVLLLGLMLEPSLAFATLAAYLLEGAAGLPVFTPQGPLGILHLMGPDGGFLLAYPFAAFLVSKLRRTLPRTFTFAAVSAAAGAVAYFLGGASWIAVALHQPVSVAFDLAVWPFVAGDALKVVLAAAIVAGYARFRSRSARSV